MNTFILLRAFDGAPDAAVERAANLLGMTGEERRLRRTRPVLRAVLLAAALALLLAACGYAAYRAVMRPRTPSPADEMRYYVEGNASGREIRLNHGDTALALQFDTEEEGYAHAFRVLGDADLDPDWEIGDYCPTFRHFLNGFTPEQNERLSSIPPYKSGIPDDHIRTLEQSLREAGLTEEAAEQWLTVAAYYEPDEGPGSLKLRIELYNGPDLHGIDLICGWPKGEAELVLEDSWKEYQRLEAAVDVEWKDGEKERINYLFLFHPEKQYLLVLMAHPEDFGFDALMRVAENTLVLDSGFRYRLGERSSNFSVLGFASG